MEKIDACRIVLTGKTSFFPGETVKGYMFLSVNERFKINQLYIELDCYARVYWTEDRTENDSDGNSRTVTYTYSNRQTILSKLWMFEGETHLECGEKKYSFEFALPSVCPPTYSDKIGRIAYEINGVVDSRKAFSRKEKVFFTVKSFLNLNNFPYLKVATGAEEIKHVCCGPCKSKPIKCKISIPKTGYVFGENIHFTVTIHNQTNMEIEDWSVYLKKNWKYKAKNNSKHRSAELLQILPPFEVTENDLQVWRGTLKVPAGQITMDLINNSEIIQISYSLVLRVNVSLFSVSKKVIIPIIIGTERIVDPTAPLAENDPIQDTSDTYNSIDDYSSKILQRETSEVPPTYDALY